MQRQGHQAVATLGPAFILTFVALMLWGLGHRLYATLLPDLAAAVPLSPAGTDMARAAIMIGYFVMALPSAFISRSLGCKVGVLFGLGLFAIGMFLFHPAVDQKSFFLIILGAAVIGSGLAVFQITMVPLVLCLGTKSTAIRRMNFAQAFTPLGTIAGVYLGQRILDDVVGTGASATGHNLMLPLSMMGVAAIGLAFALELAPFPAGILARSPRSENSWASFLPPLQNARFRFGVMAQLCSLSAQVVMACFVVGYTQSAMPSWTPAVVVQWYVIGILILAVGRFVGAGLMLRFEPMALLVLFCVASAVSTAAAAVAPGMLGIWALLATSFFLSIQMPTICAHALRDLGEMAKSGAAIMMFVAFSGAGVIGLVALRTTPLTLHAIMIVPALCFVATTACVLAMRQAERAERRAASTLPGLSAYRGPAVRPIDVLAAVRFADRQASSDAADNCPD